MSKKYVIRLLIWFLLVVILSIFTYYNKVLFINPLNQSITDLEQKEKIQLSTLEDINNKIFEYNLKLYDDNTIKQMIPDEYDENETLQFFVYRPINLAEAKLLGINTEDVMPENINWSNSKSDDGVMAKKIMITFEIQDMSNLSTFIDELAESVRCVYFGNINFTLPGEKGLISTETKIKITMDYYLFYMKPTS